MLSATPEELVRVCVCVCVCVCMTVFTISSGTNATLTIHRRLVSTNAFCHPCIADVPGFAVGDSARFVTGTDSS